MKKVIDYSIAILFFSSLAGSETDWKINLVKRGNYEHNVFING